MLRLEVTGTLFCPGAPKAITESLDVPDYFVKPQGQLKSEVPLLVLAPHMLNHEAQVIYVEARLLPFKPTALAG